MSDAIIITLIICGTFLAVLIIGAVGSAMAMRRTRNDIDELTRKFFRKGGHGER